MCCNILLNFYVLNVFYFCFRHVLNIVVVLLNRFNVLLIRIVFAFFFHHLNLIAHRGYFIVLTRYYTVVCDNSQVSRLLDRMSRTRLSIVIYYS